MIIAIAIHIVHIYYNSIRAESLYELHITGAHLLASTSTHTLTNQHMQKHKHKQQQQLQQKNSSLREASTINANAINYDRSRATYYPLYPCAKNVE